MRGRRGTHFPSRLCACARWRSRRRCESRALCCSRRAMSWLSRTVMAEGRITSISTMYRAPKWYALTCNARGTGQAQHQLACRHHHNGVRFGRRFCNLHMKSKTLGNNFNIKCQF